MFFFKRPKIVVDCFTDLEFVYNHSKIQEATKFYPEWWLKMAKEYEGNGIKHPTIKRCPGIADYYQSGFMLPMWSDLIFELDPVGYKWTFADGVSRIDYHDPKQFDGYADPEKYHHGKIASPWRLICKKDINFLFTQPAWNYQPVNSFSILTGVLNFKYNHETNINIIMDKREKYFKFNFSDPLVHLIPLSEKEIILKHHLITKKEFDRIINSMMTFVNGYRTNKKLLEAKEKKCPFNFRGDK
jgi:hypothetical protein